MSELIKLEVSELQLAFLAGIAKMAETFPKKLTDNSEIQELFRYITKEYDKLLKP